MNSVLPCWSFHGYIFCFKHQSLVSQKKQFVVWQVVPWNSRSWILSFQAVISQFVSLLSQIIPFFHSCICGSMDYSLFSCKKHLWFHRSFHLTVRDLLGKDVSMKLRTNTLIQQYMCETTVTHGKNFYSVQKTGLIKVTLFWY